MLQKISRDVYLFRHHIHKMQSNVKAGEERKQTDKDCKGCSLHQWRYVHLNPRDHPRSGRRIGTESNQNSIRIKTDKPFEEAKAGFNTRSLIGVRGGSDRFRSAKLIIERLWCKKTNVITMHL